MATFDPTMPEQWYPIPSLPGYEISSHFRLKGRFRSLRKWAVKDNGYLYAIFRKDGRYRAVYHHHIVAEIAHGPRPDGMLVLHRDDDRTNNHPSNLYYGTAAENKADAHRNGRVNYARGERKSNAVLTDALVREIRRLASDGMNQCAIGRKLGVDHRTVNAVIRRRRWAHVT